MTRRVIALSGGIGGAKLMLGLAQVVASEDLLVIANTGDDFEHCGLHICPDIDTLIYTLSGRSNTEQGWGLAGETWTFMQRLRETDPQQAWFQLGDQDIQTHRFRTRSLAGGATLSEVTAALAQRFGVAATILPMSDDPVRTFVRVHRDGDEMWLPFQEYFVKHRCAPRTLGIEYRGSEQAAMQGRLAASATPDVAAVLLGPSNPYLSIDPILSIPGMAGQLRSYGAPVIAVSPIVGGAALKGPTAKIMHELGIPVDVISVARHYHGLIDGLVIDHSDQDALLAIEALGIKVAVAATVMVTLEDRIRLAQTCLEFAGRMR